MTLHTILTLLAAIALTAIPAIRADTVQAAFTAPAGAAGKAEASPAITAPKPSAAQAKAAAAPLDLSGLEKRLRETKAIGVFTKLALKNQVDDLLEQFKAFHERRGQATLEDLREQYNLLLLKVLSLLQSKDPRLARDLSASREAIWDVLADPEKFSKVTAGG